MKPIKTPFTEMKFILPGGTEENDLPVHRYDKEAGGPCFGSTWWPSDEERTQIAMGAPIELLVWSEGHPPVAIRVGDHRQPGYRAPYNIQFPGPDDKWST